MATTLEFLGDYGVEIRANGQKRWLDEVKAQIVVENLKPGVTVNAVAARYGLGANHLSEWRGRARDGKPVLLALEDDDFSFAPLVLSDGNVPPDPLRSDRPGEPTVHAVGPIEIILGRVTIRLNGAMAAVRIAEIVRAIGTQP